MKLSTKLREAMRNYYQHRELARAEKLKWNKLADMKAIEEALPKNCIYFQASAGTFWLTWKKPHIQTCHSENNYWSCKVMARFNRKKKVWEKTRNDPW